MNANSRAPLPTLYIPHGGGPCFFMDWNPPDTWRAMGEFLSGLGATVTPAPTAVLVISAHWETPRFTVMAQPKPVLLYDYYGFPEHTYHLEYPAPGSPALAQRVEQLLTTAGIAGASDTARGFDHGVFIPFKLIYPAADIPIVQLSLQAGLDPAAHLALGRALQPLRSEGVLIVGSGMSYHNMQGVGAGVGGASDQFDDWLADTVEGEPALRDARLRDWLHAPAARVAHPREEHLLPLMVAAGAAGGDRGRRVYRDRIMGCTVAAYQFG